MSSLLKAGVSKVCAGVSYVGLDVVFGRQFLVKGLMSGLDNVKGKQLLNRKSPMTVL